ncbi:hypothetical protein KRR26_27325 [Corallococcus sp. M34]|nr:hypothetical protein [Citreicoccus inhibens]
MACLVGLLSPVARAQQDAGAEPPRFAWPLFRVVSHVEASEVVEAAGLPVALRAVQVKESPAEVVQKLADAFLAAGLFVPPGREQPQLARNAAMLTAADMERGLTYTAILQAQPDGTTLVYLGEANHVLRRAPDASPDFAPLPPDAREVLRVGGEGSRTLAFHVALSGEQVDAFYARALPAAGWRRGDEAGLYTRANEELRVVHQPGAGGLRAVVLVYRGRAR